TGELFKSIKRDGEMYGRSFFSKQTAVFHLNGSKSLVSFAYEEPIFSKSAAKKLGGSVDRRSPKRGETTKEQDQVAPDEPTIKGYRPVFAEFAFDGSNFQIGNRYEPGDHNKVDGLIVQKPKSGTPTGGALEPDIWQNDYWREAGYHVAK